MQTGQGPTSPGRSPHWGRLRCTPTSLKHARDGLGSDEQRGESVVVCRRRRAAFPKVKQLDAPRRLAGREPFQSRLKGLPLSWHRQRCVVKPRLQSRRRRQYASYPLKADSDSASFERDNVANLQLSPTTAIDLAVYEYVPVDNGLLHIAARVEQTGELQELPEANALATNRDVVDRVRVGHP